MHRLFSLYEKSLDESIDFVGLSYLETIMMTARSQIGLVGGYVNEELEKIRLELAALVKRVGYEVVCRELTVLAPPAVTPNEKWEDRTTGRSENPATFIRRVYADEIKTGKLTRAALASIDFKLSEAYASWIRPGRHPEDSIWPEIDGKRRHHNATLAEMAPEDRTAWNKRQHAKHRNRFKHAR